MIVRPSIWRERWRVWVPAAVALIIALGLLLLYRTAYANRMTLLRARLAGDLEQLSELRGESIRLEGIRQRIAVNETRIGELYDQRLATERDRFTAMVAEVKELAQRSGLEPGSISYPKTEILRQGLVRKGVVFGVDGTYDALRRFLHLTELSDEFVTVESIGLGSDSARGAGGALDINLTLSAWFKLDPRDVPASERNELPGARPAATPSSEAGS